MVEKDLQRARAHIHSGLDYASEEACFYIRLVILVRKLIRNGILHLWLPHVVHRLKLNIQLITTYRSSILMQQKRSISKWKLNIISCNAVTASMCGAQFPIMRRQPVDSAINFELTTRVHNLMRPKTQHSYIISRILTTLVPCNPYHHFITSGQQLLYQRIIHSFWGNN